MCVRGQDCADSVIRFSSNIGKRLFGLPRGFAELACLGVRNPEALGYKFMTSDGRSLQVANPEACKSSFGQLAPVRDTDWCSLRHGRMQTRPWTP